MGRIDPLKAKLKDVSEEVCIEALCQPRTQELAQTALGQARCEGKRKRLLPPSFMIWIHIAMPLFRNRSIPGVVRVLLTGMRERFPKLSPHEVTDDALAHARARLSVGALVVLFRLLAKTIDPRPVFAGLRVWLLDGSTLDMPDTPENGNRFGRAKGGNGPGAFPRLRLVVLLDVMSRRVKRFLVMPFSRCEQQASLPLTQELKEGDLVVADRGFYRIPLLTQLCRQGADFLLRTPKNRKVYRKKALGPGDWLGWIEWRAPLDRIPKIAGLRVMSRNTQSARVRLRVRILEYQIQGGSQYRLMTSLLDEQRYAAKDLARLYAGRWEVEIAFKEIKTHLSQMAGGVARTILRSKKPKGVLQEVFGLMIAYNLVRGVILEAAEKHGLLPQEIGFVGALETILLAVGEMAAAQTRRLPLLYDRMLNDLAEHRLRRPRRKRSYPRAVRRRATAYPTKQRCSRKEKTPMPVQINWGIAA